ncbi:non-canonical purine NTP pyrophosphatase [Candidatus Woesearchaeota archaeon]|nr:non-canonical purine NTP pyrophosphatase [Candidatus Woesearchaeota archaeon]
MKIFLVTKNPHKVREVSAVLDEFGIEVGHLPEEKYEPKEMDLRQVAEYNAKKFYEKFKKPVAVDDTGVFFRAYPEFPGNHPKLMFELIGYKGLLKLLEGEDREAEFRSVVGYCDEKGVKVFEGALKCVADTKAHDLDKDVLPYERILLVDGRSISQFSREEKNNISHRAAAFRKLGKWLTNHR